MQIFSIKFKSPLCNRRSILFLFVYLLFLLSIGIGYISVLPVFEGFDETAHYSSLRQISDTRTIPLYGKSYLSQEIVDYKGPISYSSGVPPFDRGMVYSKFFKEPDLVDQYQQVYREQLPRITYSPSNQLNWQAQHPPMYYLLLAPLISVIGQFSFSTQFYLLRLTSFVLVLCGVAFGLLAVNKPNQSAERNPAIIGFFLYPIILPMFFQEFTRIGNDSLCIFFAGFVAYLFSLWIKNERNTKICIAIGLALGLGLLTKVFFIAITLALAIFLLTRLLLINRLGVIRAEQYQSLLKIFLPAILIGCGWYLYQLIVFGEITGSSEAIRLAHQGGLIAGLKENFSFYILVRSMIATLVSFSWAGTWSLTRLPPLFHFPLLILFIWVVFAYLRQLNPRRLTDPIWLPVYLWVFFVSGLLWRTIGAIALNGNANTPGWYLHILMPWSAPAIGIGISSICRHHRARILLIILLLYTVLYQIIVLYAQLALFTGCAIKGEDKYYVFTGPVFSFDQSYTILDRMFVLGYPGLAITGFIMGLICFLWLLVQVRNSPSINTNIEEKLCAAGLDPKSNLL